MLLRNLLVFVTEETEECLANTCALHRQEPAFVVDDTHEGRARLNLATIVTIFHVIW